jgi:hypothetical protein
MLTGLDTVASNFFLVNKGADDLDNVFDAGFVEIDEDERDCDDADKLDVGEKTPDTENGGKIKE